MAVRNDQTQAELEEAVIKPVTPPPSCSSNIGKIPTLELPQKTVLQLFQQIIITTQVFLCLGYVMRCFCFYD